MRGQDRETHARLLDAAADLFASRGFKDVTVREICAAAGANVAAVNYHFGGKLGLYSEVVSKAIEMMRATTDAARAAGIGAAPEQKLRAYVRVFLRRLRVDGHDSWIHRLMAREIADPTPALDRIADHVLAPRIEYLSGIIADLTGRTADDGMVRRCALSVQAQCHAAMPHPLARRALGGPEKGGAADDVDRLTDHIADFSLAGIRGVERREQPAHVRRVRIHRGSRGA